MSLLNHPFVLPLQASFHDEGHDYIQARSFSC